MTIDPAQLVVPRATRMPVRLTVEDIDAVHANRCGRLRRHGGLVLEDKHHSLVDVHYCDAGFGLGFRDGPDGALSHHVWMDGGSEHGPHKVLWMAYETVEQFIELMGVLRNLDDQLHGITIQDQPRMQMQALLRHPFRRQNVAKGGKFDTRSESIAYWQFRVCNVPACVAAMRGLKPVRFNLELSDPVERFLTSEDGWRGVGGSYVVELGDSSWATEGRDESLPMMRASVNAFSRLWLGVQPPSTLPGTDDIEAPSGLLTELDEALRLSEPAPDWDY